MNSILCDYVFNSSLSLVSKIISISSQKFSHSHPYKSKENLSSTEVHNTLGIKTKLLGHPNEIETQLVNGVTSSGYYFVVRFYENSLYKIPYSPT